MRPDLASFLLLLATVASAQKDVSELLRGDEIRRRTILTEERTRFTPLVVRALVSKDPFLRRRAALALREMDPERPRVPEHEADGFRPMVVAALAYAVRDSLPDVRDEAIRSLLIVLRNRDWGMHSEPWTDPKELQPLIDLGPIVVPVIAEELRSGTLGDGATLSGVRILSKLRSKASLEALLSVIRSATNRAVVHTAMTGAIAYDDPRVAPVIVAYPGWYRNYEFNPGLEALRTLGQRAVPAMLHGLGTNPDPLVRQTVIEAFAEIIDPRSRPLLIRALQDSDPSVAVAAAGTLIHYPHPTVLQALSKAATGTRDSVRYAAQSSLRTLRGARP